MRVGLWHHDGGYHHRHIENHPENETNWKLSESFNPEIFVIDQNLKNEKENVGQKNKETHGHAREFR